jgi:hypothetical protein
MVTTHRLLLGVFVVGNDRKHACHTSINSAAVRLVVSPCHDHELRHCHGNCCVDRSMPMEFLLGYYKQVWDQNWSVGLLNAHVLNQHVLHAAVLVSCRQRSFFITASGSALLT